MLAEALSGAGHEVVERLSVPDERDEIAAALVRLCDEDSPSSVLTTGGTGFAPRDVTPEATGEVLERLSPGIDQALRADSLRHTPHGHALARRLGPARPDRRSSTCPAARAPATRAAT